jgi:hypothetical protein
MSAPQSVPPPPPEDPHSANRVKRAGSGASAPDTLMTSGGPVPIWPAWPGLRTMRLRRYIYSITSYLCSV